MNIIFYSIKIFLGIYSFWFFRLFLFNFLIISCKSLFNLFSVFFFKVKIIFRIILLMFWSLWSCSFRLEEFTMFLVQVIKESWLKLGFNSLSFAFVVFGICVFHQFSFKFFLFYQFFFSFLFLSHVLKFLILIQPWDCFNIKSALGKWRDRLSKNFFDSGNTIHEKWMSCSTDV